MDSVITLPSGYIVKRTRIIGTTRYVYTAWEEFAGHTTVATIDGKRCGEIGQRPLPAELASLPAYTLERADKVASFLVAVYMLERNAIYTAYPHLRNSRHTCFQGSIDTYGEIE